MPELPLVKCTGCGACVHLCTKKAISLSENQEGFLYPKVDDNLCVNCGLCEKNCPVNQSGKTAEKFSVRKVPAAECLQFLQKKLLKKAESCSVRNLMKIFP